MRAGKLGGDASLHAVNIPLLIPDLPGADELLPYLRRIDAARWYTNFGPLVRELEVRLAAFLSPAGAPPQHAVSVGNATLGLEVALLALELPPGSRVLMPALTFMATATAAMRAGYVPVFCDVDPQSWLLTPEIATRAAQRGRIDAVMPVSTYGCPCDIEAWDAWAQSTGLPVVIDAAGAFGNQACGARAVTVFSLHATKALSAAEGGLVMSADPDYAARVRHLSNFGIDTSVLTPDTAGSTGLVRREGTNAKLSEYHAAVGLAALERFAANAARRVDLHRAYLGLLQTQCPQVRTQARAAEGVYSIFPVCLPEGRKAAAAHLALAGQGIGSRRWYCPPLNQHPAFAALPVLGELPVCSMLGERLLALPFHTLMGRDEATRVVAALAGFLDAA